MSENTLRDLKEEGTRLQAASEGGKKDTGACIAFLTRAVTGICGEMLNLREGTPSLRSHEELTERVDRLSNPRVLTLETQVAELMKRAAVADALAARPRKRTKP